MYQRGWRLGGKGASSRGPNGRIEEHGLHLWLGYYENAFRLLRECYVELDRPRDRSRGADPDLAEAMLPARDGRARGSPRATAGTTGSGSSRPNDLLPGEPDATGRELSVADVLRRALQLITDFLESLPDDGVGSGRVVLSGSPDAPAGATALVGGFRVSVLAAILEATALLRGALDRSSVASSVVALDRAIAATNDALRSLVEEDADLRRTWHLVAVMTAVARGMLADGIVTGERGFRDLNDEDFLDWITRHGAPPDVADFAFIRGLYDLVFAEAGAARSRRGVSAGVAVFLTTKMFFEYRGAIFWKMAAGMGDIVFAPLYEALRRRGVRFEFFHRVDRLRPLRGSHADRGGDDRPPGSPARRARHLRPAGPGRRSARLPVDAARRSARRDGRHRGRSRSSRTSATGRTPRHACFATARTSTSSCSRSRSAWRRSSAAS